MLQTVLGLEATHIASAFLVFPAAMGQRLVRAKAKIHDAGNTPSSCLSNVSFPERLQAVLALVLCYIRTGWEDVLAKTPSGKGLQRKRIWLARTLVALCPDSAEPKGPTSR